jgi:hypothetical protein
MPTVLRSAHADRRAEHAQADRLSNNSVSKPDRSGAEIGDLAEEVEDAIWSAVEHVVTGVSVVRDEGLSFHRAVSHSALPEADAMLRR